MLDTVLGWLGGVLLFRQISVRRIPNHLGLGIGSVEVGFWRIKFGEMEFGK